MVFAAAHAGDDRYWAAFVAGHLRWQDLAEGRHEGAGVLIGLSGEVLLPPASESAFRIMSRMISTGLGLGIAVLSGCLAIFMLPGWISRTT